ncbi:MAG: nucleotidyltransferase domain-containing protein [Bacteroidales bacterium]|nr:nucleotidyltransferase domain-containing protein [Bacteroidales bacterium]
MISDQVKTYIPKIQEFFKTQPILKAWIFGSCSRGEERPDSDLDLLVDYDRSQRITLLRICGIAADLEDVIGRPIDLVERDCLHPFAIPTSNRDKILIYERNH